MLYLLASWSALVAVMLPVGIAILRWTGAAAIDRVGDRVVLALWLGVGSLGSALLALSLAVSLSPLAGAILGLVLAGAALLVRGVREELRRITTLASPRIVAALAALAAAVALFTAQPVVWSDTGLYHAGAIRWLSEFGAVPGLGLLDLRFGYVSSWFALAAPFNPDGLREHGSAVMGGFGLFVVILQALICVARGLARRARRSDWFVIGGASLLAPILAWDGFHVSASPDLPAAALILVAAWSILLLAERPASADGGLLRLDPSALPLLLGLGALAIKLQALPLVAVVAVYYVFSGEDRLRRGVWAAVLGLVAFGPWLAFQVLTTGCPAYPLPACTDASWSVGADTAREASEIVQNYARWLTETPSEGGLGWVGEWLTRQIGDVAVALAAGSAVALAAGVWAARRSTGGGLGWWVALLGAAGLLAFGLRAGNLLMVLLVVCSLIPLRRDGTEARWLLAIGLAGIALILYSAPDFRFALGYMAVLAGRLVVLWGPSAWERFGRLRGRPVRIPSVGLPGLATAAAALAGAALVLHPTTGAEDPIGRIEPIAPPELGATVRPFGVNGIEYRVPPSGFCRTAELPCVTTVDPRVELRDPTRGLEAGFERD